MSDHCLKDKLYEEQVGDKVGVGDDDGEEEEEGRPVGLVPCDPASATSVGAVGDP